MPRKITSIALDTDNEKSLERFHASTGRSRSSIINEALAQYFDESSDDDNWTVLFRRLNRQRNAYDHLSQRMGVLSEMFLLFVQYFFANSPTLTDDSLEEVRVTALARFQKFENSLLRTLRQGGLLTEKLIREISDDED